MERTPGFLELDPEGQSYFKSKVSGYRNPITPTAEVLSIADCKTRLQRGLADLASTLRTCYGQPCVVLIDEFDAPFMKAFVCTSQMKDKVEAEREYEQMTDLLMGILTTAVKVRFFAVRLQNIQK